ncbi:MAG: hypothetical protein AB4911_11580 [Oscillochloridaceae bacterium umkhey_bin13]
MRLAETVHRYPRPLSGSVALLSALLVTLAVANLGTALLRGFWDLRGRNEAAIATQPWLAGLVAWIDGHTGPPVTSLAAFLPTLLGSLAWTAAALLLALLLRNALPTIRASDVGMLVEFAGSWLPLRWDELDVIRVTSDVAGEHFVLLVETHPKKLTSWHGLYSFVYGLGRRPGFLVTSNIGQFDQLLQMMISQSERTARAIEGVRPVQVREDDSSPLFRLLLSPASFFSGRARDEAPVTAQAAGLAPGTQPTSQSYSEATVQASYPPRISQLFYWVSNGLFALLALSYLGYWVRFLALTFPAVRSWPIFDLTVRDPGYAELYTAFVTRGVPFMGVAARPDLPAPWWLLVAAHLMLLLGIPAILWVRSALPTVESRNEGLAVQRGPGRWWLIPWEQVRAFRATEIDDERQILLLQASRLPNPMRMSSLLYDGSFRPGVLITSAAVNFQPLIGHALNRLVPLEQDDQPTILQQDARSWLIWLALERKAAMDALVTEARGDLATKDAELRPILARVLPMALLALLPVLLLAFNQLLGDAPPRLGLIGAMLGIWIFAMLEWPLFSISSVLLDERTGGGEEGFRAIYLYPTSQLARALPMLAAILFEILRLPLLPILGWAAAMAWAYWLAQGLCEQLYEWKGSQAVLGGLIPVLWQLLLLIVYLLLT